MSSRKKILVAIDWYLPGYKAGGPIRSCASIINCLKDDFDFAVLLPIPILAMTNLIQELSLMHGIFYRMVHVFIIFLKAISVRNHYVR